MRLSAPRSTKAWRRLAFCSAAVILLQPALVSGQECVAPPPGLVGWWTGDGILNDIQGNNHAVLHFGATYDTGFVGEAFSFDGVDDRVRVADPADGSLDFGAGDSFSWDAWIATTMTANSEIIEKQQDTSSSAVPFYQMAINPDGTIACGIGDGSTLVQFPGLTPVNDGNFHHVACVRDVAADALIIYVDGQEDARQTDTTAGSFASSADLVFGGVRDLTLRNFEGIIDEIEIFDRALSAAEIQALYDAGSAGKCKPDPPTALLGPSPYLSFAGDSPFASESFGYLHLEDFEDALLDTPGVSATCGAPGCGVTSVVFGPSIHDSVDEDDGSIDGSGLGGDSFFSPVGSAGVTFTFDPGELGSLPTHVGIVWTDGPPGTTVTAQAFGPGGVPLDTASGAGFANSSFNGETAEDRFFGFIDLSGISAIRIDNSGSGGIEVDHLQYGSVDVDTTPPTADAGPDQTIRAGDTVSLDGSASFDDNSASVDLAYAWSFSALPAGSAAALSGAATATPTFVADVAGTYFVELTVTDEAGLTSLPDEVLVSSDNLAPTADAGEDQLAVTGTTVFLDGSGSSDPEGDPLLYAWTLTSAPAGSAATLSGSAGSVPFFTPDLDGSYQITLVVSDFLGAGPPDTVAITATAATDYAEIQIFAVDEEVVDLGPAQITNQGNLRAFRNYLSQAVVAIQEEDLATAIDKLEKSILRTDDCALRGHSVVGTGQDRDWITDCTVQLVVYDLLNEALGALEP